MSTRTAWKNVLAVAMAAMLLVTAIPATYAEGAATFTTTEVGDSGIVAVQNPGVGKALSYSKNSGVSLLKVGVGGASFAFKDLNRNRMLDKYEDWRLSDEKRAADLVDRLTIEEIAGLMLASYHFGFMGPVSADLNASVNVMMSTASGLLDKGVRAMLNADAASPTKGQAEWTNAMQAYVEGKGYGIPVNVFSDPRSNAGKNDGPYDGSHSSVSKWPGSLGFAATFDPSVVRQFGEMTSKEYRALGITTALSPQIDVGTEPRWNRINGTFGESAKLSADMTRAYVSGFQSTVTPGGDTWGADSVATMVKHWPGDGMGEAGRESHANVGKYAVYPGNNLPYHLMPFSAVMKGQSGTGLAAAVMPSYSIGIAADGSPVGGDPSQLGSGVSPFKMTQTLRGDMAYDGLVCTDWGVSGMIADNADGTITDNGGGMAWGTGDLEAGPRVWSGIKLGVDMYGGLDSVGAVLAAYKTACEEIGEEAAFARFKTSAYRALLLSFRLGLFDDPYLDVEASIAFVGNEEYTLAGYEAQLKSVVMLKNDGLIKAASGEKPTVYIPMAYTPEARDFFSVTPASIGPIIDEAIASEFFNVVSDTLNPAADPAAYTADDIVPRTDFAGVDFALVKVSSPVSPGDMFTGYGYDVTLRNVPGDIDVNSNFGATMIAYREGRPIDNGYLPKTLQYRPYTADPDVVRKMPIVTDAKEEEQWIAAGGEPGTSRYYGGKTTVATNEAELDLILRVVEAAGDVPVAVMIAAESPMIFSEFEPQVEAIVMGFGISDRAMMSVVAGQTEPSGLLPLQMPRDMVTVEQQLEDVPFDMVCHTDTAGHEYDYGFGLNWQGVIEDERTRMYVGKQANGTYNMVVDGFEWGPGVTKIVMELDCDVAAASVTKDAFSVIETKKSLNFATFSVVNASAARTVTDAYACDAAGNRTEADTPFVAIEMAVNPDEGNPFFYDFFVTGHNDWADPYTNSITLTENALLKSGEDTVTLLSVNPYPVEKIMPKADRFDDTGKFTASDDIVLTYASFAPAEDDKQNALVIWLHGAGEGGVDPDVVLLGNEVTELIDPEIQDLFSGAYMLAPQSPTMWMDNGGKDPNTGAPTYATDENHESIYTKALMELIESFVAANPDIDPKNIFIGGCSNGGFMTMNMLLHNPSYFRAAYPVCEAYMDAWITDEMIASIAHIPVWFTYADTDTVVSPLLTAVPTSERLKQAGAEVHVSGFPSVLDTSGQYKKPDGTPYEYMGHWSWIYTLNNECVDTIDGNETTIWQWMAAMYAQK